MGVVAGGGEGTGDAKDDDFLALEGADVQALGKSASVLQRRIEGARDRICAFIVKDESKRGE